MESEKLQIPEEIYELIEETDDKAPSRPAAFYNVKWFFSNVSILFLSLCLLIAVSAAAGAWKHSSLFGDGVSTELPGAAGLGKWDSYEYDDLAALLAEAGSGQGKGSAGHEDLSPAQEGEEDREHALFSTADLGDPELKGKCGFEKYEPSGRERGVRLIEGPMSKFGSLYKLLKEAGLSANDGAALQKAMEKFLNVKLLRAEDHISLYVKEDTGAFWFLSYKRSDTTIYHFLRMSEGGIDAHKVIFPTRKEWTKAGGVVHGSLYRSVEKVGLDGSIVNHFAEVLGAYINFSEHTREGDIFKVIVSSEWVGKKFMAYDPPQALYYKGKKAGEITAILYPPDAGEPTYYKPDALALKRVVSDVPLKSLRITSPFNLKRMHPVLKVLKPHYGTDFCAPTGTPIYAYAAGAVKTAKNAGAMGNMVHIDHGGGIESYYGHMHGFTKSIKSGVAVKRGQLIGYVGNTGRSTGPHLHFGIKKSGKWVDPMKYLSIKTTNEYPISSKIEEGFFKRARTLLGILGSISIEDEEPAEAKETRKVEPAKKPAEQKKTQEPKSKPVKKKGHSNESWDTAW